jgi:hypothetical protein
MTILIKTSRARSLADRLRDEAASNGFAAVISLEEELTDGDWYVAHTKGRAATLLGLAHMGLRVVRRAIRRESER